MPRSSFADVQLEVDPGTALPALDEIQAEPDSDTPFRILVMGDFGGQIKGKPVKVDRDNFDDVLEACDVRLTLPLDNDTELPLRFLSLNDFHPDAIYRRVPLFGRIEEWRDDPAPAPPVASREAGIQAALGISLLEAAVEATESRAAGEPAPESSDPLARYIRSIVAPHLAPKKTARRQERERELQQASAGVMRQLLHHPLFQPLEAAWRGLHFLVRELETGPLLSVHLLDVSKAELTAELGSAEDLRKTVLFRVLTGQKWAVALTAFCFTPEMEDLNLLGRIGLIVRQARVAFIGGASPRLLGCDSLAEAPYPEDWNGAAEKQGWDLIRSLPEARHIGLVLPRMLLRMPYGKEGESCDGFPFEEMDGQARHEQYLWGSGAWGAACLLGQTFSEFGWRMEPGEFLNIHGLPMHVYREQDGEARIKPGAEVYLSERAVDAIHARGLMALLAFVGSGDVRLSGFRSIASPEAGLNGPWV
ncbi:MAG: type VI secretion system contractile sheath large subunit [Bryobacteraceae bacterium]|nr:type VI secretion system contractile sheath large subunit [Bryobacteraceae bacterium]